MNTLARTFTGLAGLAFVLAVVANFSGPIMSTGAEAFSRASTNLALLAIAINLIFDRAVTIGRSTLP